MQFGLDENDLLQAEQSYRQARERLRSMAGDAVRAAQRVLFRKSWLEGLNRARNDCLSWMGEVNARTLQLHAQRQATYLYDQLGDLVRRMKIMLAEVQQAQERAVRKLEERAAECLEPASAEDGIFELNVEAVGPDYIRDFYEKRSVGIQPSAVFLALNQEKETIPLEVLAAWSEQEWVERLQIHAQSYFAEDVENTSLLGALQEHYGKRATEKTASFFDRLVRYCHPFWQYDANSGIQGQEGKSIIGVEDEHSILIPERYRQDPQYEIKSTGFKHRIDFARVQHGLPASLLHEMADYKAYYDKRRKGIDPLHIFPEAYLAQEVLPEQKSEARNVFAVTAAFDYIIQIGSFYYFDPQKEYSTRNIRPVREYRLDQGREKAEDAFVQRVDFVQEADQLVEKEIVNMGNQAAVRILETRITEYKQAVSKMPPDSDLRRQFEDEVRALQAKQVDLGKM